jgi:hypothetical protein
MLRYLQINADPGGRIARFGLAIADAGRRLFEWLVWPFERLAWPFLRLAWVAERRLVWPLRERAAGRTPRGPAAGAAALAAVAVAAVAAGVLLSDGHGEATVERTASPARVASVTPPPESAADKLRGPALQGVPPSFGVSKGVGVAKEASGASGDSIAASRPPSGGAGEAEGGARSDAGEGAATASSAKPVPAGPAAMKVARRFADAFVFYEIGKRSAHARAVFGETATPQLAGALAERPPRLPEGAEVPKAKVVNLVPGPRHGKAYTVSASLLRVGLTSELRLEMKQQKGEWLVTDVRG